MKTQTSFTVITELTEKNFKRFGSGKAKISVALLDGVWVDAWVNPKFDEKVNFVVGDIVMITANRTKSEDNEYNGQTRKQHSFFFPDIVPVKRASDTTSYSSTPESNPFGETTDMGDDVDLPF